MIHSLFTGRAKIIIICMHASLTAPYLLYVIPKGLYIKRWRSTYSGELRSEKIGFGHENAIPTIGF